MKFIWAFLPFILFALINRFVGPWQGLLAGAITSVLVLTRDLALKKSPKILEVGTVLLFGGLFIFTLVERTVWSLFGVRLMVDLGLLLIVLVSLAIRRPFSLQYAREQASPQLWEAPMFLKANYLVSSAWAFVFLLLIGVDLFMVWVPAVPARLGIAATVIILLAALIFTTRYFDLLSNDGIPRWAGPQTCTKAPKS